MNEKPSVPLIRDILHLPVGFAAGVISGVINGLLNDDLTFGGLLVHTVIFGAIFGELMVLRITGGFGREEEVSRQRGDGPRQRLHGSRHRPALRE